MPAIDLAVAAGAIFNEDKTLRFHLWRMWDRLMPHITWVLMNPSTADEFQLDNTLTLVAGYSNRWGYGSFEVVNAFAFRTPYPKVLYQAHKAGTNIVGDGNNQAILDAVQRADKVILGWGNGGAFQKRNLAVLKLLRPHAPKLHAIRLTTQGHPYHPLYQRADLQPFKYPIEEWDPWL